MDLKEFIKTATDDIVTDVDEVSFSSNRKIRLENMSDKRTIEFDIAVSAESTDSKEGKAGIRVLQFAEGGGTISKSNKNSTVSRIQFGMNVSLLTNDEEATQRAQFASRHRNNQDSLM